MSGELAKRTVRIRLLAKNNNPSGRTDFKHPDLPAYVRSVRPKVFGALQGLVESWKAKGAHPGSRRFGRYESWAGTISGILEQFANGLDRECPFLGGLSEIVAEQDEDTLDLRALVGGWLRARPGEPLTPTELVPICEECGAFQSRLARAAKGQSSTPRGLVTALGCALKDALGEVGKRIVELDDGSQYRIIRDGRHYVLESVSQGMPAAA